MNDLNDQAPERYEGHREYHEDYPEYCEDYEASARKREPVARKVPTIFLMVAGAALLAGTGLGVVLSGWGRSSPPAPAQEQTRPAQKAEASAPAPTRPSATAPTRASAAAPALQPLIMAETTGSITSPRAAPAPAPQAPVMVTPPTCANPNAMGIARVVEIDTTGGPGFGSQHFKSYDFLNDHEVVLTFDDGPWLGHTPAVLKALADQCVRATFFSIGKHATYYPDILRKVVAGGHTIGTHTWSHIELEGVVKTKGLEAAEEEFEKGASAVRMMAGTPIAPFFRFPELRHPNEMLTYLGERNVAIFSADVDSWDFRIKKPEELTKSLMGKVRKAGKGIILMHDFQKATSIALPQILAELQKDGFKVVHMVPKTTLGTLPQFDEAVQKEIKMPVVPKRPQEAVVRTLNQ
jgi:peptidoglycan/xylan/chitin deacetylase (PgdA/CDA1 family)